MVITVMLPCNRSTRITGWPEHGRIKLQAMARASETDGAPSYRTVKGRVLNLVPKRCGDKVGPRLIAGVVNERPAGHDGVVTLGCDTFHET